MCALVSSCYLHALDLAALGCAIWSETSVGTPVRFAKARARVRHAADVARVLAHRLCARMGAAADYFYEALERHGLLAAIIRCAQDDDANTRKFACFALGNGAFHSAALYPALRSAIAPLMACLQVGSFVWWCLGP